jgi:hypothetical protein
MMHPQLPSVILLLSFSIIIWLALFLFWTSDFITCSSRQSFLTQHVRRFLTIGFLITMPPKRHQSAWQPPPTQRPPLASSTIDRSKPYSRICIDYGTRNLTAHSQLVHGGLTAQTAPIDIIWLKHSQGAEHAQVTVYDTDGNLIYGQRDVAAYIRERRDSSAALKTLRSAKMALIPEFRNSKQVQHVREVLGADSDDLYIQRYLTDHIKCVLRDVKRFHAQQYADNDPHERATYAAYIASLPIELQLPVPVMMDDDGWADLRNAALLAGATEVELREEPICVLACFAQELDRARYVKTGQSMLVLDVGGLTCDIATCKLLKASSAGDANIQMQRVGQCHGNGAGSNLLNDLIIEHVLQRRDEYQLDAWLERLQIEEHDLLQQLSDWFDRSVKPEIDDAPDDKAFVFIAQSSHGQVGVAGLSDSWQVKFNRTTILRFYDIWIRKIKLKLYEHLSTKNGEDYACAILAGKPFRSAILEEAITKVLATYRIRVRKTGYCQLPCSQGGLTQHIFEKDALPNPCFWYISQAEEHHQERAKLHPDVELHGNIQRPSQYEPDVQVVHDRFMKMMLQYSASEGFSPKIPRRLLQEVLVKIPRDSSNSQRDLLHIPLYWSNVPREEHSAVFDFEGKRQEGLRSYPVMFELPEAERLEVMGFAKQEPQGTDPYYLIHVFVELHGDASSLAMSVTFMLPSFARRPRDRRQFRNDQVWFKSHSQTIWTPTSSHFPNQFITSTDARSRFDPHDELPAVEPTRAVPPAIDHPSGLSVHIAPSTASLLGAISRHYAPPMAAPLYAATAITTCQSLKRRRETLQEELTRRRTSYTPQ